MAGAVEDSQKATLGGVCLVSAVYLCSTAVKKLNNTHSQY